MSKEKTEVIITEIRKRLKDDKDGSYRDEVLKELDEASASLEKKIKGGLAPKEFSALSAFKESVDCSRKSVNLIWQVLQAE